MELVTKLTRESLEELKHAVTTRFFAAHLPVDAISFEADPNNKDCVHVYAQLRFSIVHYTTIVALHGDFRCADIDVGHDVVGREIILAMTLRSVPHENLNIETRFEF